MMDAVAALAKWVRLHGGYSKVVLLLLKVVVVGTEVVMYRNWSWSQLELFQCV